MQIDVTCPVEVLDRRYVRDHNGHIRVYLQIRNCGKASITSIHCTVLWKSTSLDSAETMEIDLRDAEIPAMTTFSLKSSAADVDAGREADVLFDQVQFDDGCKWESAPERIYTLPDAPELPGPMANALRNTAGEDAVCAAYSHENGCWQCVCGRWNAFVEQDCMRCMRKKDTVLEKYSPEAVEQLVYTPRDTPVHSAFGEVETISPDALQVLLMDEKEEKPLPKRRIGSVTKILLYLLLAAVLAFSALSVRKLRYMHTSGAGLMPTSDSRQTQNL